MIKLITDSSCLYTPAQAKEMGFVVNPLLLTINDKQYVEFVDIEADEFVKIINQGYTPTSSQPSVGQLIDTFNLYPNDQIIVLTITDGLSGTYQTALLAKNSIEKNDHIHVINTKTLCGPHKYLVEETMKLINEGKSLEEVLTFINHKIDTTTSFLLPQDFGYLKRGGRLTPIAATLAGVLKLQPVVTQTADGKRLDKFVTGRNYKIAVSKIIDFYKNKLNEKHRLYISHGFNLSDAEYAKEKFKEVFPNTPIEILELSCAFITQGGPKCVAIQTIEA